MDNKIVRNKGIGQDGGRIGGNAVSPAPLLSE